MRLEIISGQEDVVLSEDHLKILDNEYIVSEDNGSIVVLPENKNIHPRKLYTEIRDMVNEHIDSSKDLFIITYSEIVYHAVRVCINRHCFEGARLHQVLNDVDVVTAEIGFDGSIMGLVDGIFDTTRLALLEILEDRRSAK